MAGTDEFLFIADGTTLQFYDGVGSRASGVLTALLATLDGAASRFDISGCTPANSCPRAPGIAARLRAYAAGRGGDAGGFPVAGHPRSSRCGTGCARVSVP